jgi:DNA polymerase IV
VSDQATILHADVDAFFASVEQRDDPGLRGKPVIVGGGVVLAASYEARAHGVRGAMGGAQARRLCPQAIVVPPRFNAYVEASRAVFEVFEDTAPLVEGISLEEAFMDVRGLERISGSPEQIAARLRAEVRRRVSLTVTVGIARTKFLAKMASGAAKPDGLLRIPPDGERAFLHPMPVEAIWGVGAATARRLHAVGIRKVSSLAALDESTLMSLLGRASGRHLHALTHGRDPRPVRRRRRRRSIGSQSAMGRSPKSPESIDATLVALADRVTRRARSANRIGRTVTLRMRFGDYTRATRSQTLGHATAGMDTVLAVGRDLLAAAAPLIEQRGLTLLGLTLSNLAHAGEGVQLALPLEGRDRVALDTVMDEVRERYGPDAVKRAKLLGRQEISPPLSP